MTDEQKKEFEPKAPDYRGDGIAIWKATTNDEKKQTYLKVKVLGGKTVNCFKYIPKPKAPTVQEVVL